MFRALPPRPKRAQAQYSKPLFSRKIVCGACGQGLMRQKARRVYYRCTEKHGPLAEQCSAVRIYEDDLTSAVLTQLRGHMAESARSSDERNTVECGSSLKAQITALEQQIEKQWSAKSDAFVKWNSGMISKSAYEDVCANKRLEIQHLEHKAEQLKGLLTSGLHTESRGPEQLTGPGGTVELSRRMVDTLVETVHVFEGGRVEVKWKSQNKSGAVSAAFTEGVPRLM